MSRKLTIPQFVIDHVSEAVFLIGPDAHFIDANTAACKSLDYTREELLQLMVTDIDPQFPMAQWDTVWNQYRTLGSGTFESIHQAKDGTQFPVEINANFITHDEQEYICALVRNISERKRAEQVLHESEERLTQYLEVVNVIILSLDTEGRVQMINPKGCEVLGYPSEEILQRDWFSNFLPEEDKEKVRSIFQQLIAGDIGPMAYHENAVRTRDGTLRIIAWRNAILTDSEGHITGTISSGADITDKIESQRKMEQAKKEWNYAMDFFDDPIYLLDLNRHVVRANQAFYTVTHTSEQEILGRHIAEILHPEGEKVPCPVCRAQEERRDAVIMMEADHPDNPTGVPIEVICRVIRDQQENPTAMLMTIHDLSRARKTQEKLTQSRAVFDSTIEGIMITDTALKIVAVNPAFTEITGYTEEEALGKTPRLLKSDRHEQDYYRDLWADLQNSGRWQGEIWNRRKNGEIYPEWLTISTVKNDSGEAINYVGVFSDISQLKQSQSRLEFLAHHDPLTSLPNRLLFRARLEHAIERARRNHNMVAVLFLDLDRFKHINDSLGHTVGDALLEAVAQRFSGLIRNEDTIARLGGDEFVILMEDPGDSDDAATMADKVIYSLKPPFNIKGYEIVVGTSIGISLYPQDGDNVEELLRNADAAMYRAKDVGRNTYQYYTEELTQHAFQNLLLEGELRKAIEQQQLTLHYQPQVNLQDGSILGVEALVRWQHPEHGLIPPGQFIPLAEETKLIIPLGEWVLRHACIQARTWLDNGIEFGQVSVNIAGPQIRQTDLLEVVSRILNETGLPPERLELEITENFIMGQQPKPAIELLLSLRKLGVSLAIDDFGTGYSSLAYLKQLPINKLKIDRSFVTDLPDDENDAAITRAVIALGHSMLFTVIAEGVETQAQRDFLINEGCEQAQGYFYSRAVDAEKVQDLLHHKPI